MSLIYVLGSLSVKLSQNWPDYVFAEDYSRLTLSELRTYINDKHHLPTFEPAAQYEKEGIDIEETTIRQQEWLETSTLYILELQAQIEEMQETISRQEKAIDILLNAHQKSERHD